MAFDLTKPSMSDADWPTFAANIRENFRAIVEGDSGVYTKTTDITLQITTTGTANVSRVSTRSGNGTTSGRSAYFRSESLETTPQAWHAGMLGDKNFGIRDETAAVTRVYISQSTGNVGVGAAAASGYRVHVTDSSSAFLRVEATAADSLAGVHLDNDAREWRIFVDGANSDRLAIRDHTASLDRIIITSGGKVGIGIAPTANLHVLDTTTTAAVIGFEGGNTNYQVDGISAGGYGTITRVESQRQGSNSGGALFIYTAPIGGGVLQRIEINNAGSIILGTGALATSATGGFLYLDSCAGTPSGTPTAYTGRVPLIYDTTNNKLYAYNGAWKSVTLA